MSSSSIFVFPFVVAIKPSQVSPCSSKSLATQDTPVLILTSSNDIHFPATSSLFHEGTVSSSVQPLVFPSSSVQIEGKARNVFFQSCKLLFISQYFSVNSSSADLPRFSSNSVLSDRSVEPRSQDPKKPHCTHRIPQIFHWYTCGADRHSVGVRSCDYLIIYNYPGPLDLSTPGENLLLSKICRNKALKLALSVQKKKNNKPKHKQTKQNKKWRLEGIKRLSQFFVRLHTL